MDDERTSSTDEVPQERVLGALGVWALSHLTSREYLASVEAGRELMGETASMPPIKRVLAASRGAADSQCGGLEHGASVALDPGHLMVLAPYDLAVDCTPSASPWDARRHGRSPVRSASPYLSTARGCSTPTVRRYRRGGRGRRLSLRRDGR